MKFVTQHKEENIEDEQTTNSYLNPQQFTLQTLIIFLGPEPSVLYAQCLKKSSQVCVFTWNRQIADWIEYRV